MKTVTVARHRGVVRRCGRPRGCFRGIAELGDGATSIKAKKEEEMVTRKFSCTVAFAAIGSVLWVSPVLAQPIPILELAIADTASVVDYENGVHVVGTSAGDLYVINQTGEYTITALGAGQVNDVRIEHPFIAVAAGTTVIELELNGLTPVELWRTTDSDWTTVVSTDLSDDGGYVTYLAQRGPDWYTNAGEVGVLDGGGGGGSLISSLYASGDRRTNVWIDATADMEYIAATQPMYGCCNRVGVALYRFDGAVLEFRWWTQLTTHYDVAEVRVSEAKDWVAATTSSGTEMCLLALATGLESPRYNTPGKEQYAVDGDDNLNYVIGANKELLAGYAPPYAWFILENLGASGYGVVDEGTMLGAIDDLDSNPDASLLAFGSDAGEFVLLSRSGDAIETVFDGDIERLIDAIEIGECSLLVGGVDFINLYTWEGSGACCLPDDTCQMLDPLCCLNQGGVPQGPGSACLGVEACCDGIGFCYMADVACCLANGDTPQGPGSVCTASEACCFADDTCEMLDPLCCVGEGGTPQGAGSACGGPAAHEWITSVLSWSPDAESPIFGWVFRGRTEWFQFTFSDIDTSLIDKYVTVEFHFSVTNRASGERGLDGLIEVVINPDSGQTTTYPYVLLDNVDPSNFVRAYDDSAGSWATNGEVKVPKSYIIDGQLIVRVNRHPDHGVVVDPHVGTEQPIDMSTLAPTVPPDVYKGDDAFTVHIGVNTDVNGGTAVNCETGGYCVAVVSDRREEEACCLPDGTCVMADALCCVNELGGVPQGPGTVCTAPQACCFSNNTCSELDPLCCAAQGGIPQGQGSTCGTCGDGTCQCHEDFDNCCQDCECPPCTHCEEICTEGRSCYHECVSDCGDGTCDPECEDCVTCEADCGCAECTTCNTATGICDPDCGNGVCQPLCLENCRTCPNDCTCDACDNCSVGGTCLSGCGDGTCDPACENCDSCPQDCHECGDGCCTASAGETCCSCAQDCGPCCGNGVCDNLCGEDCSTCPDDCQLPEGEECMPTMSEWGLISLVLLLLTGLAIKFGLWRPQTR